jgi:hypothetical protein
MTWVRQASPGGDFTFVNGLDEAISQAREAEGDKDVHVMGGADIIRQALGAGHVDEFSFPWLRSCSAPASGCSKGSPVPCGSSTTASPSLRSRRISGTASYVDRPPPSVGLASDDTYPETA